ncbi:hypothetical protein C9I91_13430 [Photobacterium jeanii]|nr:hypothetical protein C9I91_13430 [Photobacterium jeanii]
MKKAVALLSLLALFGCTEEELKDTLQGKTKVFAVESVQVQGLGSLGDGTHSVNEGEIAKIIPQGFPNGTRADLDNVGVGVHSTTCGKIDTTTPVCFDDKKEECTPKELKQLNLKVYKIDITDIKTAYNAKFFPTLATELGIEGLNQIDIQEVACN